MTGPGAAECKQVCPQLQQKGVEDMDDGAYDDIKSALSLMILEILKNQRLYSPSYHTASYPPYDSQILLFHGE